MRKQRSPKDFGKRASIHPAIILFSAAFFAGSFLGYFLCRTNGSTEEIKAYLTQYSQALTSGQTITAASLLGVAVAYYRIPAAIYLCGFFRKFIFLFCAIYLTEGLLLSFAVTSFVLALNRIGVLISLCVFGVRLLFVLPISLSLAVGRCKLAGGESGRRVSKPQESTRRVRLLRLLIYSLILAAGVLAELSFVPDLICFAMRYIS